MLCKNFLLAKLLTRSGCPGGLWVEEGGGSRVKVIAWNLEMTRHVLLSFLPLSFHIGKGFAKANLIAHQLYSSEVQHRCHYLCSAMKACERPNL